MLSSFAFHPSDSKDVYQYPDIIALVKTMLKDFEITSFIMDAEVVAIDPDSKALKSFQELSNRARKDVNLKDVRVSVCVFAFDLMFLNAEVSSLIRKQCCLFDKSEATSGPQLP